MYVNRTRGRRGQRRQAAGVAMRASRPVSVLTKSLWLFKKKKKERFRIRVEDKEVFFDVKGGENVLHAYVHMLIYLRVCVCVCVCVGV